MGKKQNFTELTFILLTAAVITKIFGAAFKIPLAAFLGGEGMGYYMTAYSIFGPVSAVALSGMTTAMSKITAEHSSDVSACKNLLQRILVIYSIAGLAVSFAIYAGADVFAEKCGSANSILAVKAIAPAFFFCAVSAAIRGYFEGMRNMYPTAVSEVAESFVKLAAGSFLACAGAEFALSHRNRISAMLADIPENQGILAFTAAMAVAGVSISAFSGTVILAGYLMKNSKTESFSAGDYIPVKSVILTAFPICMSALTANISSVIDLSTVVSRINYAFSADADFFRRNFDYLSEAESPGVYFFGAYSGMAITVFNIMSAIAAVFQASAVPVISESLKKESLHKTAEKAENILEYCFMAALPMGISLFMYSESALKFLFPARGEEIAVIKETLSILGIDGIFVSITIVAGGILQAAGKSSFVMWTMGGTALFKFMLNYLLIGIPEINLKGAGISTGICYFISAVVLLWKIEREFDTPIITSNMAWIFSAGVLYFLTNIILRDRIRLNMPDFFAVVINTCIAFTVYVIFLLITGVIDKKIIKLSKK